MARADDSARNFDMLDGLRIQAVVCYIRETQNNEGCASV